MAAPRSRYASFLILAALLLTLVPLSARAQSDQDLPTFSDTMDGASPPLLSDESPDPDRFVFEYANGEFILRALEATHTGDVIAPIDAGQLANSRTAVDAALAGNQTGKYVFAGCRAGDDNTGYYLQAQPGTGFVSIWRLAPGGPEMLAEEDASGVLIPGYEFNRIEIECSGATITGIVNGEVVISASDDTYQSGTTFIGVGNTEQFPDVLFAVFDNLEVFDLNGGDAGTPSSPAAVETEEPTETPAPTETPEPTGTPTPTGTPQATESPAATETPAPTETPELTATDAPTETPDPTETPAPTETPEPTPTEVPTETSVPEVEVDTAALEASVIEHALATGPIVGPFIADVELAQGTSQTFNAGVLVTEFHTEVRFVVPFNAPPGAWSIGFCFWVDSEGNCYDGYIRSDGVTAEWIYGRTDASGESEIIQSGEITGLDLTPGASNFIGLSIIDGIGIFIVNSADPAVSFPLDPPSGQGDVVLQLGFEADDPTDARSFILSTDEFYVWDLSGLATPEGQPTEAPEPTATPEATVEAEPTAEEAPPEDELTAAFNDLKGQAVAQPAIFGPFFDSMPQSGVSQNYASAVLSLTDVYTTATFVNPSDTSVPWDVVVGIRTIGDNTEPRFVLQSSGEWLVSFGAAEPALTGQVSGINVLPLEINTIEIAAQGDTAYVAVNGTVVTEFDISSVNRAGDVYVGTGFLSANIVEGRIVGYQDLQVWEIPPSATPEEEPETPEPTPEDEPETPEPTPEDESETPEPTSEPEDSEDTAVAPSLDVTPGEQLAGPLAGVLVEATDTIEFSSAEVDVADFYVSVVIEAPEEAFTLWDFTVAFRHTGGNDQYRLTIVSDGTWLFALGNEPPIATGELTNLVTTPGEDNTIELFVQGETGAAALNGEEFTTLDVSEVTDSGDVWIATATNAENTLEDRTTPYRDFAVWALP